MSSVYYLSNRFLKVLHTILCLLIILYSSLVMAQADSALGNISFDRDNTSFMPGFQKVEILLDNEHLSTEPVMFQLNITTEIVEPCMSHEQLNQLIRLTPSLSVDTQVLDVAPHTIDCYFLTKLLPDTKIQLHPANYIISLISSKK